MVWILFLILFVRFGIRLMPAPKNELKNVFFSSTLKGFGLLFRLNILQNLPVRPSEPEVSIVWRFLIMNSISLDKLSRFSVSSYINFSCIS